MMPAVERRSGKRTFVLPAVVAAVGAAVLLFALTWGEESEFAEQDTAAPSVPDASGDPAEEEPPALDVERRDPDDPLTDGPVDAPVTLVVYSDYQCPFCAAWSYETLPTMREYAAAGELRIEWRDINILTPEASERASIASYAAGLQDRFWDYHEALFPDGDTRAESELTDEGLVDLAVELGLDEARFVEDMAAPATAEQINRNAQEGLSAGAFSTPAFVLDGRPMLGAQPTQIFVDLIEHALANGD